MTLDKNTFPYYDDFDQEKKYLQMLFFPGKAVQARELSQLQSILQDQISKFGSHIFKEGSMVIPGESSINVGYPFIKLEQQFNSLDIDVTNFVDKKIIGLISGTVATVIQGVGIEGGDPNTLYLSYDTGQSTQSFTGDISTGSATITDISIVVTDKLRVGTIVSGANIPANTYIIEILSASSILLSASATDTQNDISLTATTMDTFVDGEDIATIESGNETVYNATLVSSSSSGLGSTATIKKGIYFVKGYFVIVDDQVLLLDKYSNTPSYNIGLTIVDSFVTEDDDATLNDPASGTTNFNAPGAHRYKIDLLLTKFELDDTISENFVQLIQTKDGEIQKLVTRPAYSELEKTLARRTYDESGDYTVRHFPLHIKEHLNDGTNGGVFSESDGGDEAKLVAAIDPGKAFVRGYEIETQATQNIAIDKSREFISTNNAKIGFNIGNFVQVDDLKGSFDITSFESVNLYDAVDAGGSIIGSAKIRSVEFVSGTPGDPACRYNLYLFDIEMDSGASFSDVRSIGNNANEVGNAVLVGGFAVIGQAQDNALVMPIPEYAVKTVSDTIYSVKRYLTGTMTANSGDSLQLTAGSNEVFDNFSVLSYHVSIITASGTATGNGYAQGDVIDLTDVGNSVTLGGSPIGKTVTITIPDINGSTIAVIATINKTLGAIKTKTLTNRVQSGVTHSTIIQLDRSDVYRINSITAGANDITNRYVLDNGQRDNYYDRGKLFFDQNYAAPMTTLTIDYDYFEHSVGDYFSVDSYDGTIDYKDIPFYFSTTSGKQYDLINALDFRPRINNAGTGFTGAGGSLTELVVPDDEITTDYDSYVGRIDKLVLTSDGEFKILTGTSDINPVPPPELENSMVLYVLYIPPFTFKTRDIDYDFIDNRRYTMRDIGKLEKRIDNLEYYTSLSLLEKATSDLFIDDGTGLDRFKNGFVVDNFTSHKIGDIALSDYLCAIDPENGILRPSFVTSNVGLSFISADSSNYTQTGDLITLPYTTEVMISQLAASKTENVNPYNIISWSGNLEIDPPSDDWYEENRVPDKIIIGEDSAANAQASIGGSTVWNDWTTDWVGKEISRTPVSVDRADIVFTGTQLNGTHQKRALNSLAGALPGRSPVSVQLGKVRLIGIPGEVLPGSGADMAIGLFRDTVVKEKGQTRTGVRMDTVLQTVTENLGDKVVSVSTVPFMRSKVLTVSATRLRPNTRVYPFFDGVDVSVFCNGGLPIITDVNGSVSEFTFTIPSTDAIKFRTGARVFKLIDNTSNNDAIATTSAESLFTATGILQTKEATLLSTRVPTTVRTTVTESRVTTSTNIEERTERVRFSDPLAQTFLVEQLGGAFISKIDIYFNTVDDSGIPVTLQIREVINGYPGQRIIPFGQVTLNPNQITTSTTSATATSFVFNSPVYLQDGQEYCFVLLSNSNKYTVWVSRLGETDIVTSSRIVQQPYAGSLFKSQNASTWTAEQEEDVKFKIHKCVFNDAVTGTVVFKNDAVSISDLIVDPFTTEVDSNDGNIVTVFHRNHGLATSDKTTISGVESGSHNGIPHTELNGLHTVTVLTIDRYTITVSSFATDSGRCGGSNIQATRNIVMDVGNANIQNLILPGTNLSFGIKTTSLSEILSGTTSISLSQNIPFTEPQLIRSDDNEDTNNTRTVHVIGEMGTTNTNISPVIDVTRSSIIAISNRINDLSTNETADKNGDALAKYITKRITLKDSATALRVYVAVVRPANATIEVYAKILTVDEQSNTTFDEKEYTLLNNIDYPLFNDSEFKDYTFELDGISPYNTFAVKIVMRSSETSDVPLIKDFRAIALGS